MSSPVTGAEDLAIITSAVIPIDTDLLAAVCEAAAASPRLRSNHNLHGLGDLVQRFLNALQPGTYVRPHRLDFLPGLKAGDSFYAAHGDASAIGWVGAS